MIIFLLLYADYADFYARIKYCNFLQESHILSQFLIKSYNYELRGSYLPAFYCSDWIELRLVNMYSCILGFISRGSEGHKEKCPFRGETEQTKGPTRD